MDPYHISPIMSSTLMKTIGKTHTIPPFFHSYLLTDSRDRWCAFILIWLKQGLEMPVYINYFTLQASHIKCLAVQEVPVVVVLGEVPVYTDMFIAWQWARCVTPGSHRARLLSCLILANGVKMSAVPRDEESGRDALLHPMYPKVCQMLSWWTKYSSHSINIQDIVTLVVHCIQFTKRQHMSLISPI